MILIAEYPVLCVLELNKLEQLLFDKVIPFCSDNRKADDY